MALLDYVAPEATTPRVRELHQSGQETFGRCSLFLPVLAHHPDVLEAKEGSFEAHMTADRPDARSAKPSQWPQKPQASTVQPSVPARG